jgi:hypothetical protein
MRNFYRHKYGGVYQKHTDAINTVDGSKMTVYTHIWPYDHGVYVRPKSEFDDGRFQSISGWDVKKIIRGDRELAKQQIEANHNASSPD